MKFQFYSDHLCVFCHLSSLLVFFSCSDIVSCLFLCGDTAERSMRQPQTVHRKIYNAFPPFRVCVCVWDPSVSFPRCLISCDILCWPGICILMQEPRSTTTIHAKFASAERGSNAHFGFHLSEFVFSGLFWHRKSTDKRNRQKETTSTNATDAVVDQAHCLHHIYGHFSLLYMLFFFLFRHLIRRQFFSSGCCVCVPSTSSLYCISSLLGTRMTMTGNE